MDSPPCRATPTSLTIQDPDRSGGLTCPAFEKKGFTTTDNSEGPKMTNLTERGLFAKSMRRFLFALLLFWGWAGGFVPPAGAGPVQVVTTTTVLKHFVEVLGKDRVRAYSNRQTLPGSAPDPGHTARHPSHPQGPDFHLDGSDEERMDRGGRQERGEFEADSRGRLQRHHLAGRARF